MTTSEFVAAVLLKATGKVSTLTSADTKWQKIVAIGNNYIKIWQNENGIDWQSLRDPSFTIGTVSATDTYELDDEIRKLSNTPGDQVVITKDGTDYTFDIVDADKLSQFTSGNYCARYGRNLKFNREFASTDAEYGGTITAPVYLYADLLTNTSTSISVDDPEWLVVITAAEYVRNDITKQNQYSNLVSEANSIMSRMKDDNDGQITYAYAPWQPGGISW